MRKSELVYRELLQGAIEKKRYRFTQIELARAHKVSLSTINNALKPLRRIGAIRVKRRSFEVVNLRKILYYWASTRNLEKDVIYKTRVEIKSTVVEIEKRTPPQVVFGAYSAYKFRFRDVPADYSEVYIYLSEKDLKEVVKRFPQKVSRKSFPNLFVLKKDFKGWKMPLAQIFVDLWNLKEWYAWDFVRAFEERLTKLPAAL